MKLRNIIQFAYEEMVKNLKMWFLFFVAGIIVFIITAISLFLLSYSDTNNKEFKDVLRYDIERYGIISAMIGSEEEIDFDKYDIAMKKIKKKFSNKLEFYDLIDESSYINGGMFPTSDLAKYSKSNQALSESYSRGFHAIPANFLDQYNIKCKLTDVKNDKLDGEIYLGYDWGEALLGKTIKLGNQKYLVRGITEKGTKIISCNVWNGDSGQLGSTVKIDNWIMIVPKDDYEGDLCYRIKDGFDPKTTKDELANAIKNEDISSGVMSLDDALREIDNDYNKIIDSLLVFAITLLASVIIIYFVQQYMYIIDNKQTYGIYYVSGATLRDFIYIQLTKTLMQFTCSMVVAITLLCTIVYSFDMELQLHGNKIPDMTFWILHTRVIPLSVLIDIIISIIASVVPICILSKKMPYEMMKEA
ncbi:FtsX-like permease family protein [Eubacterium xylanophilum]|uniref:FtsX-like permease family protein n=1 Tax=Eubacterium xylanophilum TaxID=39497 RepID=UPI00047C919D|nr:FtsX-like permease family protein [Eubacterium xylanophilum]